MWRSIHTYTLSTSQEKGGGVSVPNDEYFTQYVDKVQTRMKTLYQDAQQFPANHSQQLITTLEELRLAVEELHVAEEELMTQNEQLAIAQQTAEIERQRYQSLFNLAPDGYLVTDLSGVVQEANYAAASLLNIDQKYLTGKPLMAYVCPTERAALCALLNQIGTSQRVQGWELKLQGRRPEVVVTEVTLDAVQNAEGNAVTLRWQIRDISDRKKAEAAINQLQAQNLELLENDRIRTQFLATASHELKTPMNAILGFSQMLIRQFNPQHDAAALRMTERIFHNGQHLLDLIEEMLNFSQLRVSGVELKLETFDLVELVATTLEELRPLADQKVLALTAELPPDPVLIVNDRGRLRQILTNLLSNAIKFTDTGKVTVSVQVLPAERLLLVVKDTGCGISPQDQPHIFKEFWQVHHARNQAEGTGLGLAIVWALVKLMQGTIRVESVLNQGSQFRVELPLQVTPDISLD
jgi:PAS domain S-box-containing protein